MRIGIIMASVLGLLSASPIAAQAPPADTQREAMLARAKAAEIKIGRAHV